MNEVTRVLSAIERGDPQAADQLLPLVYEELRKLAAQKLAQEKPGQTLQATALVHEAYLRLLDPERGQDWNSRGHFFAAAAEAMRRILVDNARRKRAVKRGGDQVKVELDQLEIAASDISDDLLTLDEALTHFAAVDPKAAELVKLRYFAGLTSKQAAEVLGVSPRTADSLWAFARAWLLQKIQGGDHNRLWEIRALFRIRESSPRNPSPEYALSFRATWRWRRPAMTDRDLFIAALNLETRPSARRTCQEACGDDLASRQRVEALFKVYENAGSFLESPPASPTSSMASAPPTELSGTVIGPYKLLQQIGEGGMGAVYMAEQTQPVRRTVALKLIKAGMDSRQVLARFEAERQALALMDHPNIAKVLDAGTTDTGRPYFVMELVKGVPITQFCDERRLTPRERLELFIPVCQAVQHAHQKGIIHRDIKPSNVLVALYDGKPVPKVIDFGVAKATGPRLTDQTLFTEFGAIVGTLEYMSPEQAELNQLDIDTRSDIYSPGRAPVRAADRHRRPCSASRLKRRRSSRCCGVIREEEPPRPSTRLSTTEELPSDRGLPATSSRGS